MARAVNKLSPKLVASLKSTGTYGDGNGLYLQISKFGTKSWVFRFTLHGRKREMGLGPMHTISLAEARQSALGCRKLLRDGIDPIEQRKAEQQALIASTAKTMTFDECCAAYIQAKHSEWDNPKSRQQWENTLSTYASPHIGNLAVGAIDTGLVLKILEPIWNTKTETASRLRGRIESVLNWATTRGYRQGENPARWRGHLDTLLARPSKVRKPKHHAAIPYREMPSLMAEIRKRSGSAVSALEFAILTAARSGEVIGAKWSEIDMAKKVWTVAASRMKARREHRVPLSDDAIKTLNQMAQQVQSEYVFPGLQQGKPLSNMSLLQVLKRLGRADLTTHGFRSTFRDWAAETTGYPQEVCEMALAHAIANKAEAAYRRGDLFEKRRRLMQDWANYCANSAIKAKVTPIRAQQP